MEYEPELVLVRGGGDMGTGTAHRLWMAGFRVVISELPRPTVIRRSVSFASAVYEGGITVEGVEARLAEVAAQVPELWSQGVVPVVVDAESAAIMLLRPDVVVDARLAKRNLDTGIQDAPIVIGLGPGFQAGLDVHAVIETNRGHYLGCVILQGRAEPDTHVPGLVHGHGRERVLWAPRGGRFQARASIGQQIALHQEVALVEDEPVRANVAGVLRGILRTGLTVSEGQKVGDVDPRGIREYCFTISDKARAVGGGVLEAILYLRRRLTSSCAATNLRQERSLGSDL